MRTNRNDTKRQAGFLAVETAMILPILLLLLMGMLDFGRFLWTRNVIRDAAAEGARLAVLVEPADSEVIALVEAELLRGGIDAQVTVVIGSRESEQPVNVDVSVPFTFWVLPDLLADVSEDWAISASSVMMHER
ncbi:MAG: pilus assembly protein [Proteobacteria bacterium]|nr:pilus assembly protein [Pseudomonadota bacterium]MBU1612285.1 pilus assembly protein [Pseudomonadota bacterium]